MRRTVSAGATLVATTRRALTDLSCDELATVLSSVHFGELGIEALKSQEIAGRQFALCTDGDLEQLGVKLALKRRDALALAKEWNADGVPKELVYPTVTRSQALSPTSHRAAQEVTNKVLSEPHACIYTVQSWQAGPKLPTFCFNIYNRNQGGRTRCGRCGRQTRTSSANYRALQKKKQSLLVASSA